ncbi:hypothetical protein [Streptomyces sp. NBC_01483]|uniref:hypothetical protein n=1 Tax=Streptomyces sp. NBC_01483 TaxID=2903883 RepID=UPI002E37A4C1|nr:hypothetical protein [Streptomyces sp. NBC_01483]
MPEPQWETWETGTSLYDTQTRRVGEYRDKAGPYAMLRPVGGGGEWQRRHTQESRHTRYRRCFADYAVLELRSGRR